MLDGGATLKVYPGAPHGLANTTACKDAFNTDLLNFLQARGGLTADGTRSPADRLPALTPLPFGK